MLNNSVIKEWLLKRKISASVLQTFEVGEGQHDTMGECVVIPVKNEGGVFSFNKYRRHPLKETGVKYLYDTGGHVTLYGAWRLSPDKGETVIWTEGELDTLVCWSHNIAAVSSTGGSKSVRMDWAELLKDKEVIICFDNDEAGGTGIVKALEVCPSAKVMFLPDRPGIKDITDYVTSGGDLRELIDTAIKFDKVEDVVEDRAKRVALWQSTFFHDAYLKTVEEKARRAVPRPMGARYGDKLERAKQFPIDNMIEFRQHKAQCPWHMDVEKDDLHYYNKTNTVYCFACGKRGDAVDIYRILHNCSFKEAVEALQ
jgi:DNA primase